MQLDIQSDAITSVTDGLAEIFPIQILRGYIYFETKMAVEASRNISLEKLPPIKIRDPLPQEVRVQQHHRHLSEGH